MAAFDNLVPTAGNDTFADMYTKINDTFTALKAGAVGDVLTGAGVGAEPTYTTPAVVQSYTIAPINLGDWNMDSTASISVPHGLGADWKKIRSVTVIVRNDADTDYYPLVRIGTAGSADGGVTGWDSTNVNMQRVASGSGGFFDGNTDFNATGYNRGYMLIERIA
jgi:hypothetical protein